MYYFTSPGCYIIVSVNTARRPGWTLLHIHCNHDITPYKIVVLVAYDLIVINVVAPLLPQEKGRALGLEYILRFNPSLHPCYFKSPLPKATDISCQSKCVRFTSRGSMPLRDARGVIPMHSVIKLSYPATLAETKQQLPTGAAQKIQVPCRA